MDIFNESKKMIISLDRIGLKTISDRINDVITYGTIATEILMELKIIFQELTSAQYDSKINDDLIADIDKMIDYINIQLK